MQKIPSLFQRNYDGDRFVRDEVVPGSEWVLAGEGVATRKYDGTSCMVRSGHLYKRYDLPLVDAWRGKKKRGYSGPWLPEMYVTPPVGWEQAQAEPDAATGHWPGWVPVGAGPEDRWHREAVEPHTYSDCHLMDGTYELCGPKVQGNPEQFDRHVLIPHGTDQRLDCPRDFAGLKAYLAAERIEGVVWHHPDGRMVKIKRKDFGASHD